MNPGGYIGFFDPEKGAMDSYSRDERAAARRAIKERFRVGPGFSLRKAPGLERTERIERA